MMNSLKKAKLLWRCRRGMLELDLILLDFAKKNLEKMSAEELVTFEQLLNCTDPELFSWFMGHETPEEKEFVSLVKSIKHHDRFRSV